ncbi:MAG: NfeD family protein [Candidatus Sericytochromatia bacterium]|nr:NfeD family protein [Candidatus Tanganyikabacteria bacterium]
MHLDAWHIWTIIALALIIGEVFTAGFVLACFAVGSLVAAIAGFYHLDVTLQLLAFSAASLAAFFGVRPFALAHLAGPEAHKTNVDALVGREALVSERLDPATSQGRVKVDGEDWWGVTRSGRAIEPGEKVVVVEVEGARLIVEPESTGREG